MRSKILEINKMRYLLILLLLFSFSSAWALPECEGSPYKGDDSSKIKHWDNCEGPSRKINYCHYERLDASFKFLRPPQLDNPKINTTGLVNEKRVEELSSITLRRTWTQIGLELGYDTNILNVLSGRSKNLGTKTALASYTSANLKMAVSFYEQIIDRIS